MPTLTQVQLPPTKDPDEFEDIVVSAIRAANSTLAPQRHGRRGQRQEGVDIYYDDELGRVTAVQCKLVGAFSIKEVKQELAKTDAFRPVVESYILALGMPRDAKLQKQIYQLSVKRGPATQCRVAAWFWDDITFMLSRDPVALSRHYPELFGRMAGPSSVEGAQSELAKRRVAAYEELWAYRRGCLPTKRSPDMEWDDALVDIAWEFDRHAKRIEELVQRLGPVLPDAAADALECAATAATDGSFEVSFDDVEPVVTREGRKLAERMYECLGTAVTELRTSLEAAGLHFS